jgi:hypothetical protein
VVLFLVENAIYITIRVKDVASLIKRSALLYIINLMPLALREHINLIASIFRIRLSAFINIYKWLGSVVIAKGLVYIAAALSSQYINIYNISGVVKLIVSHLYFFILSRANAYKGCRYWRGLIILFYSIYTPTFLWDFLKALFNSYSYTNSGDISTQHIKGSLEDADNILIRRNLPLNSYKYPLVRIDPLL